MKMRVAYVSTCGAGHLNTLRSLWEHWAEGDARLFLLCFADEPVPFDKEPNVVVITCNVEKPSENATVFNEVRRQHLQAALHVWLHDYRPTLIVYDFFCLEARVVSRALAVPAICSVPATLKPTETETCSDALLPKEHFYWVWREPYPVAIAPVAFLGPRVVDVHSCCGGGGPPYPGCKDVFRYKKRAVVTFGTVIPHYAGCQERLAQLMLQLDELVQQERDTYFLFVGVQGPDRWANCDSLVGEKRCDLVTDVFQRFQVETLIFHGGGNTYAEALAAEVPKMLVCPFFGDQFETTRQVGNCYSGDLLEDWKDLEVRSYGDDVSHIGAPFGERFPDFFRPGDLVFGHRRHRSALQQTFSHTNLHLEHYKPFAEFAHPEAGELPAIADVYNDEFLKGTRSPDSTGGGEYYHRLREFAAERDSVHHLMANLPEEHRLVHYCLLLLNLTISKWNGRIHFVLGPPDELGPATRIELKHIEAHWKDFCDDIIFYNLQGRRIPAPWSCPTKPKPKPDDGFGDGIPLQENALIRPLMHIPGRMPVVWGREKSYHSVLEKVSQRHLPLLDLYGWRTGYLDAEDLQRLQRALYPGWTVSVNWCAQRVWYYYYKKEHTEIQLWPWTYLHHFYLDQAGLGSPKNSMDRQIEMQKALEGLAEGKK